MYRYYLGKGLGKDQEKEEGKSKYGIKILVWENYVIKTVNTFSKYF